MQALKSAERVLLVMSPTQDSLTVCLVVLVNTHQMVKLVNPALPVSSLLHQARLIAPCVHVVNKPTVGVLHASCVLLVRSLTGMERVNRALWVCLLVQQADVHVIVVLLVMRLLLIELAAIFALPASTLQMARPVSLVNLVTPHGTPVPPFVFLVL